MSKSHRREVAKHLKEQIEATTDPKLLVELTRELAKLLPRPRQVRRPCKSEAAPSNQKSSILNKVTGTMLDTLPDGKKVALHIVMQLEKRSLKIESPEWKAALQELKAGLSAPERAALETLDTEEVG